MQFRVCESDGRKVEWQEGDLFRYGGTVFYIYQLDWSPEEGFTALAHPENDGTADALFFRLNETCALVEAG